jgi:hypothetical protein
MTTGFPCGFGPGVFFRDFPAMLPWNWELLKEKSRSRFHVQGSMFQVEE